MDDFKNSIVIDKRIVLSMIATLKSLDVRGFESNDRLVGCVQLLQEFVRTETVSEEKKDKKEVK